jgi:hypothetical protein
MIAIRSRAGQAEEGIPMADTVDQTPLPSGTASAPEAVTRRPTRLGSTAWIALAITAVVLVATAIVLLAGNQAQTTYPADSPEAALQGYLTAWYDDDYDTAYGFFSADAKAQMPLSSFRTEAGYSYGPENQTVTLDRTTGGADSRTLYLHVEDFYGPEFGGGGYSHDVQVRMVHEADGWRLDQPLIGLEPYYGYPY